MRSEARAAARRAPLLIEFVGLPGAGKSTVAQALAERLRAGGLRVDEDDLPPAGIALRVRQYLRFLLFGVKHARLMAALARYACRVRPWSPGRLPFAFDVLVHAFGAAECRRGGADVVLISQGAFQAVASIGVRASTSATREMRRLVDALNHGSGPDLVAYLELGIAQSSARLAQRERGGSRFDQMSPDEAVTELRGFARRFSVMTDAMAQRLGPSFRRFDAAAPAAATASSAAQWVLDRVTSNEPHQPCRDPDRPPRGRIALFVPDLTLGGAERVMLNLARGFVQRGRRVDLLLVRREGIYLRDVPPEVRLVHLGGRGRTLLALPSLVRYLRRERPDALLATLTYANVVAIAAGRIAGARTRITVREANSLTRETAGATDLRARVLPTLVRWSYPSADAIIAVSRGAASSLVAAAGIPNDRMHVLDNPVVTDEMLAQAAERVDHPWFTSDAARPVVLAAGRLTAQKDLPTLFRAFASLPRRHRARLLVLGEGELRPELEKLARELGIAEDVSLPGATRNPFAFMSRASVFVLSSAWEGSPGVLIQAMAAGAPVVSTDCESGPREILRDGQYGRLVPVGDAAALTAAIDEVLAAPRRSPPRCSWDRFSLDTAVDAYLDILTPC